MPTAASTWTGIHRPSGRGGGSNGLIETTFWEAEVRKVSDPEPKCKMQCRVAECRVSSLYGLFTLLQVVDIGPDGEAGWARAAGETKKAWAAWGLGLGLGGSADPAAGIQRLAASLSLAVSSVSSSIVCLRSGRAMPHGTGE